jgi:shikimate kinase
MDQDSRLDDHTLMNLLTWLLSEVWKQALLVVVSGGGAALLTVQFCKKFGEKWLDAQFAKRLERLKHEQAQEIEGMRRNVQWEFSRISKIHEKEFEVLPKA